MLKIIWKVILVIIILYVLSLLVRESIGFSWKDFNYLNTDRKSNVINIGFISSLSGPGSLVGVKSLSAARLAVDEINSDGGINGKTLKLLVEDGKCTKKGGSDAAQKLISDGVIGIVGGLCSSESIGMIDKINLYKVPTISHCSSSTKLSGVSKYFFRVYPSDSYQGVYAADYIKNKLNIERVSVVYTDEQWGNDLKDVFIKSFMLDGGKIISEYPYKNDNFDNIWGKIRKEKPELVYFLGFDNSTVAAFESLKQSDNFIMFGTYVWDDDNIWDRLDVGKNKIMYTIVNYSEYSPDFIKKIKERGVHSVYSCIPQAYDAVKILSKSIEDSDGNVENIIKNIKDTKYINGASGGNIQFDDNGDISNVPYIVKKVN